MNDVFVLDGTQSVSARDKILREIVSNILAHRDFSNAYTAKLVIERDKIYTENSNLPHGHGELQLNKFEPFPKNPTISKVFREIGFADELGSGMRNTNKYTKLYSGGTPVFEEDNIFRITIPLDDVVELQVGPSTQENTQENTQDNIQRKILRFCEKPRSKKEIAEYIGYKDAKSFSKRYLAPLCDSGKIKMTIPERPTSKNQKYITIKKV